MTDNNNGDHHAGEILHENARYAVSIRTDDYEDVVEVFGASYTTFYIVTNKEYGVIECKCPGLPDAIMFAENANSLLEQKPWEWRTQAVQAEVASSNDLLAALGETTTPGKH